MSAQQQADHRRARVVCLVLGTALAWLAVTGLVPGIPWRALAALAALGMVLAAAGVGEDTHTE